MQNLGRHLRFLVYGSYVFLTLCQIEFFFHSSDSFSSAFKHRERSLSLPAVFDSPSVYHPVSVFPSTANSPPLLLSGSLSVRSCSLASFPVTSQNHSQAVFFMPYPVATLIMLVLPQT